MIMVMVRRATLQDVQIHGGGPRVDRHVRIFEARVQQSVFSHVGKASLDMRKHSGIKSALTVGLSIIFWSDGFFLTF